jgi:trehalose utilization protein
MSLRTVPLVLLTVLALTTGVAPAADAPPPEPKDARPVRVVIWDEQQPQQKPAYVNFLGNAIADHLKSRPGFTVRSMKLDDLGQGVSDDVLNDCDVLVWWGHVRNKDVSMETGKRIVERIKAGKLSLVALHSAHWSSPFIQAMWERTTQEAMKDVPRTTERGNVDVRYAYPKLYEVPKRDDPLTPSVQFKRVRPDRYELLITLPNCVFPAYRADGKPSHVTTLLPDHPIARGVPKQWDIPQTEMYDEPFHVPKPDEVVFEEKWDKGEHFRSGCVWNVGKGKVFYFRPGHETYPVYRQELPLRVIENACRWFGRPEVRP